MNMNSSFSLISTRGVRSLNPYHFRAPWPFVKKGSFGHRKIGPVFYEKWKYPGQNREFPEISPKFQHLNLPDTKNYTHVQPEGYVDATTGEYVVVKEMQAELIVPDLTNFNLKPYVSFRTDAIIEKRRQTYQDAIRDEGSEELADRKVDEDERWPPPKLTPETLFDLCYGPKVREMFSKGLYNVSDSNEEGSSKKTSES